MAMSDFSHSLPDPLEAARRRYGFSCEEDLGGLEQLLDLAARLTGGVEVQLGDRGGLWFEGHRGLSGGPWLEEALRIEGSDFEGRLRVLKGPASAEVLSTTAALVLEILQLRRLGAERRRQPRGPEGASFVPGLVHELCNFLFAMGAGLDAFAARFGGWGDEADHAEALRRNLTRLQAFVDELRDYGNPGAVAYAEAPLMPVLGQALRLVEPLAASRGLKLDFEPLDPSPVERMDRPTLTNALRLLMEMCLLEAQEGGAVGLSATLLPGPGRPWAQIRIAAEPYRPRQLETERIFEPFYYRERDMSRLGPAIARRAIEAHGGQVRAAREEGGRMVLQALLPVWTEGSR